MTNKRKSLSKKIRFEVFKRDKFTCQYCGKSAPDVILHVDHIEPVSKGGSNDILNLITSCFDCNMGKKDRKLSDNTVIQKQRHQMELLQEKREQLELMMSWKKSLEEYEDNKIKLLSERWAELVQPYELTKQGLSELKKLLKQFSVEEIFDNMKIAADKYITYEGDKPTQESVNYAWTKIGGICAVKTMPGYKKKISYAKGICKNRFNYWCDKKAAIIFNNYVEALREQGYNDNSLESDIENDVIPMCKKSNNWSEWKETIEIWIMQIKSWKNK